VASLIRSARRSAHLSQAELAQRAGTSQPALARYETGVTVPTLSTLERLLDACGRRLELRAGHGHALAPQLRSLRRRRRRLLSAAQRHGVRAVRVFGSAARGDTTDASDVDLLVDLEEGRSLLDLLAFQEEAEAIAGTSVDVATTDLLKEHIRDEVLKEAVPL